MARMNLNIYLESNDVEEGIDILSRLQGLKIDASPYPVSVQGALAPSAEAEVEQAEGETQRRRRRTKAEIAADNAAEAKTKPETNRAKDIFGDQITEAVQETATNGAITPDQIKAALTGAIERTSASKAKELIESVTGGATRISEIASEHYPAVLAALNAAGA